MKVHFGTAVATPDDKVWTYEEGGYWIEPSSPKLRITQHLVWNDKLYVTLTDGRLMVYQSDEWAYVGNPITL